MPDRHERDKEKEFLPPEVILLIDPELAMDTDPWLPGVPVEGVGGFSGQWSDYGAMLAERPLVEAGMDSLIQDWQRSIEPPSYVLRLIETADGLSMKIYVELITDMGAFIRERHAGSTADEAGQLAARIRDAKKRNWLYGRFYSMMVPQGEFGCIHRSQITHRFSKDAFDAARLVKWPRI